MWLVGRGTHTCHAVHLLEGVLPSLIMQPLCKPNPGDSMPHYAYMCAHMSTDQTDICVPIDHQRILHAVAAECMLQLS
jgi:hypothetical protein